jgi:hypothetical protein
VMVSGRRDPKFCAYMECCFFKSSSITGSNFRGNTIFLTNCHPKIRNNPIIASRSVIVCEDDGFACGARDFKLEFFDKDRVSCISIWSRTELTFVEESKIFRLMHCCAPLYSQEQIEVGFINMNDACSV